MRRLPGICLSVFLQEAARATSPCLYGSIRLFSSQTRVEDNIAKAQAMLKQEKRSFAHYILNKEITDCVLEKVCGLLPDKAVVLECNPGFGLLTEGFLKSSKVSKVIAAETLEDFLPDLQNLKRRIKRSTLHIEKLNFFSASRPEEKETLHKVLGLVESKSWEEDPPLSIVGVLPINLEGSYMARLLHAFASRDNVFSLGRTEFYLFLSGSQFRNIDLVFPTSDNRVHHMSSILYNLLFHTTYLMQPSPLLGKDMLHVGEFGSYSPKVERSLFTPPIPTRRRKLVLHPQETRLDPLAPDMMYLVHLRPKRWIGEAVLPWEELPKFVAFLKQMTRVKRVRLIPKMESWVPGCGVHLIVMNYTMMSYVQDLVPAQYVQIYKAMLTWPEYPESNLQLLLEKEVSILQDDEVTESGAHIEATVT